MAQTFRKQESGIGRLRVPEQGHQHRAGRARGRPLKNQESVEVPVGGSAAREHSPNLNVGGPWDG